MADYIVTSGELTSVADAIREKNGTSGSLSWPNGFVSGIGSGGSSWQTVFEGSMTTEQSEMGNIGYINYNEQLTADTLKITFDGIEYECEKISTITSNMYGGFGEHSLDFSEYPFLIMSTEDENRVFTESVGTYTLKIEEPQSGGSSDFSTAKMTVINNKIKTIQVNDCPVASVDDEMLFGGFSVDGNSQRVFDVIIYKGHAYILEMVTNIPDNIPVDLETEVSLSGSAVYDDSEGYIAITGDCTITIS